MSYTGVRCYGGNDGKENMNKPEWENAKGGPGTESRKRSAVKSDSERSRRGGLGPESWRKRAMCSGAQQRKCE